MKRDMDLLRKILFAVEAHPSGLAPDVEIPGYTQDEIAYHCWLALDARLVDGEETTSQDSATREALIFSLTSTGHDFLDAARDETVWNRVLRGARGVAIDVLTSLLKDAGDAMARDSLGLPPR